MGESLIFTGSITYSMKIKDILNKNGFSASIKKNQSTTSGKGCSYGVYVSGDAEKAREILSDSGINVTLSGDMGESNDLS